jgi:hypothetical protein
VRRPRVCFHSAQRLCDRQLSLAQAHAEPSRRATNFDYTQDVGKIEKAQYYNCIIEKPTLQDVIIIITCFLGDAGQLDSPIKPP